MAEEVTRNGLFQQARHPDNGRKKSKIMFSVTHMDASGDDDPPIESLSSLYDELENSGIVDGDVAVIHKDTGWYISAHRDGRIVFEHIRDRKPRHMIPVPKERVIELWKLLIEGNIAQILLEPWNPGYT